ncbi:MAG: GNAT family N-acetyltransferase [Sphingobacteriia bacterium]|nr:GNAT family N-acetyltransferase [Sphingobacteriia bacterium]NCC38824.1 GNAT family N-acetyltransferase [Gammaproteobacteria bacterium]
MPTAATLHTDPVSTTSLRLRAATAADAETCARIAHAAFLDIAQRHQLPADIPTLDLAVRLFGHWITHPNFHVIVAELAGRLVGSVVIDERACIAGLGPFTVEPALQNRALGRQLTQAVAARLAERAARGARLVQAPHNFTTLSLCIQAGFEVREPLVSLQGAALGISLPGHVVRVATLDDLAACNRLCQQVHGHDRGGELADAISTGRARLVERDGRISGYASEIGFAGHAVGETNADLQALIGAATHFSGQGFLLPTRNGELFRWCLGHGLRIMQSLTLMSIGFYQEPRGAFLPSIAY